MLAQRRRRWANINTALAERLVLAGEALISTTWANVAEYSHIFTPYKIVGHFFGRSYLRLAFE